MVGNLKGVLYRTGCGTNLAQEPIVVGVAADPKPYQSFRDLDGKRPMVEADPNRSVFVDLLETK